MRILCVMALARSCFCRFCGWEWLDFRLDWDLFFPCFRWGCAWWWRCWSCLIAVALSLKDCFPCPNPKDMNNENSRIVFVMIGDNASHSLILFITPLLDVMFLLFPSFPQLGWADLASSLHQGFALLSIFTIFPWRWCFFPWLFHKKNPSGLQVHHNLLFICTVFHLFSIDWAVLACHALLLSFWWLSFVWRWVLLFFWDVCKCNPVHRWAWHRVGQYCRNWWECI